MGIGKRIEERLVSRTDLGGPSEFEGMDVRLCRMSAGRFVRSRRGSASFVNLELGNPIALTTIVRRRTAWLNVVRFLRLHAPVPSGDPDFDRQHHVECDDPAYARELLSSPRRREAVATLLRAPSAPMAVGLGDQGAWATFRNGSAPGDEDIRTLLPLLKAFRQNLPAAKGRQQAFQRSRRRQLAYAFGYVALSLALVIPAGLFRAPNTPGMSLVPGVATGVVFWGLGLLAALLGLRRRSAAATEFLLLVILISVLSVFSGVIGRQVAATLNARNDDSPPVTHVRKVVDKKFTRNRNGATYPHIYVTSWHPGGDPVRFEVKKYQYREIEIGLPVTIVSHAGAYGWEWLEPVDWDQAIEDATPTPP